MKYTWILFLLCLISLQKGYAAHPDSLYLSEAQLIQLVQQYHPVAVMARNEVEMAKTEKLEAKAAFDPIVQTNTANKQLNQVNYYQYAQAELKIPTWYGIEFATGIEYADGIFTDPQRTKLSSSYAGIQFSLLKNIVIDKRRAALQQAQILIQLSESARQQEVNNLLYDAIAQYWEWVQYYREWKILLDAQKIVAQRIAFTKQMVVIGERPAIDSTEAITQLQYYEVALQDAYTRMQEALIRLSAYTWQANQIPYDLPNSLQPATASFETKNVDWNTANMEEQIQQALQSHPALQIYNYKLQSLNVEKKLKFQEFLPDFKVKYNQLGKNYALQQTLVQPLLQQNYQYGVSFAMPLRLSAARSGYQQVKIKLSQTAMAQQIKSRAIVNKIQEQFNQLNNMEKQIRTQQLLVNNVKTLYDGEKTKFDVGESSLFIVNSREQKWIESQQKLQALIAKYYKSKSALQWAVGQLYRP